MVSLAASGHTALSGTCLAVMAIALCALPADARPPMQSLDSTTAASGPLWFFRGQIGAGPLDRGTDIPGAVLDNGFVEGSDEYTNFVFALTAMRGLRRWLAAGVQVGAVTNDLTMDSGHPPIGPQSFRIASWPLLAQIELGRADAPAPRIRPYVDLAAGVAIHTGKPRLHTSAIGTPVSLRARPGWMCEAAAGIDVFFAPSVAANLQAGWRRDAMRYTLGFNAAPSRSGEMILSQSCVRGGVTCAWTPGR